MKKHKWIGNQCAGCGLIREIYGERFIYKDGINTSFKRPDCGKPIKTIT